VSGNTLHVMPCNDLREHVNDIADHCWCKPTLHEVLDDATGALVGWIFVHNAADGREAYEIGARRKH